MLFTIAVLEYTVRWDFKFFLKQLFL